MRAMLPPVTIADTVLVRFCGGRQTRVGKADLLPMVELVIQQIAAASISTNGQLDFLLYGKGHTVPASGLCPHEGRFYPNGFRNIY
jgi:hypothetical protein